MKLKSIHVPDRWVVLKIETPQETLYKVLGGWSGGYLHGDSWRLNSGIVSVREKSADVFVFVGFSDSEYHCRKTAYGLTSYMAGVIDNLKKHDNVSITVLDETENWLEKDWSQ